MKKNLTIIAFAAVALFASCGGSEKTEQVAAVAVQPEKPKVKIAKVSTEAVAQLEEYATTVEAEVKNNIIPNSPLRIQKILVEVGDFVKKGQQVVQLDASSLDQLKLQYNNQISAQIYEYLMAEKDRDAEAERWQKEFDFAVRQYEENKKKRSSSSSNDDDKKKEPETPTTDGGLTDQEFLDLLTSKNQNQNPTSNQNKNQNQTNKTPVSVFPGDRDLSPFVQNVIKQ